MEWREQTTVTCEDAFDEAQRWMQEVTKKSFGSKNFRSALENGVLLCDLINQLKPGLIKRVNRLSTPIAGLDNVNVFLKACAKWGLNESQLFHPGDLQDLSSRATLRREESNRRLKNVLITIYWLGRKAQVDPFYNGPQLNFKAFEGLLGIALSKALEDGGSLCMKDSEYSDSWYPKREGPRCIKPGNRREEAESSVDFLDLQTLQTSCEGCGSDAEADQGFRMEVVQPSAPQLRAYIPAPLRRKQGQKESGSDSPSTLTRSKSLGDVTGVSQSSDQDVLVYMGTDNGMAKDSKQELAQRRSTAVKDSEAKWHDDLNKWKLRRRNTNSDLFRKLQEQEHVNSQMANGTAGTTRVMQPQYGLLSRDQLSPSSHSPISFSSPPSSPTSKQSRSGLRPHTRALLARSYAVETSVSPTAPYSPHTQAQTQGSSIEAMPASDPTTVGDGPNAPSLVSIGAEVATPTSDFPFSSHTPNWAQPIASPYLTSSTLDQTGTDHTNKVFPATALTNETFTSNCTTPALKNGLFPAMATDSTHQEHVSYMDLKPTTSLPSTVKEMIVDAQIDQSVMFQEDDQERSVVQGRGQQARDLHRYNSRTSSLSGSASLPRGYRRSEGSSRLSAVITAKPFGTKISRVSSLPRMSSVSASLEHHSELRVSLSLKPNSRPDFGFQTHWDSTGARVKSVQRGSPAELCRLSVGDEIVAVDGLSVAQMSFDQWKGTMTSALQTGSLTMDVRRYGSKDWCSGVDNPNHLFQSRKTLNLTDMAPRLIGHSDRHAENCVPADNTTRSPSQLNGHAVSGDALTGKARDLGVNHTATGSRGGSESAISNLQVPSLSPSSYSYSWDHEEERRRQEKWQEEQERLLQEQYQRDQERLEAEWQRAQQEAVEVVYRKPDKDLASSCVRTNGVDDPTNNQALLNGLTSQRRDGWQGRDVREAKFKEASENPYMDQWRQQKDARAEKNEARGSFGAGQLSSTDRAKSKSTPALGGLYKHGQGDSKRKSQGLSQAEQERQQILEEMKKRTQLLTDNSWIRQRSTSMFKEPIYIGVPMRRYESLDNLHTPWHQSQASASSSIAPIYSRPHSAAASYSGPNRSSSHRYSTGTGLYQKQPSQLSSTSPNLFNPRDESVDTCSSSQHCASVWSVAGILEGQCLEPRSECEAESPAVNPVSSNSIAPLIPPCEENVLQQIEELAIAEVASST